MRSNDIVDGIRRFLTWLFSVGGDLWTWAVSQVGRLLAINWQTLPWWKVIALAAVAALAGYCFYRVWRPLWDELTNFVKAFAGLVSAMILALPWVVAGGGVIYFGLLVIKP